MKTDIARGLAEREKREKVMLCSSDYGAPNGRLEQMPDLFHGSQPIAVTKTNDGERRCGRLVELSL